MLRPRRIFRSSAPPVLSRTLRRALLSGAGLLAAIVAAVAGLPSDALRAPGPVSGQMAGEAASVRVVDGDTLRIGETTIRLMGLDAPERGQTCRRADGTSFDCGAAATDVLAGLVRDRRVDCRLRGADRYGRSLAICQAGGRELNSALVSSGFALARTELPPLEVLEAEARAARRGLWATAFERPDAWRRDH
jgi:endonuclease YncB( thermonuclease family)